MARKPKGPKRIETLTHDEAKRKNIPTAELQSTAERMEEKDPFEPVTYPRQNPLAEGEARPRDEDLDPQIVWKGATLRLSPEQIGDENVHRVRAVMDEIFGEDNCISQISIRTTTGRAGSFLPAASNYVL